MVSVFHREKSMKILLLSKGFLENCYAFKNYSFVLRTFVIRLNESQERSQKKYLAEMAALRTSLRDRPLPAGL